MLAAVFLVVAFTVPGHAARRHRHEKGRAQGGGGQGMKKIVLTGGGTAGHVTPHLALLPRLQADGWETHYIGTMTGSSAG